MLCVMNRAWAGEHYQVITHPDVAEKSLSVNALRAIFSMHLKTWPDGRLIKVFVLPDHDPLHQKFSKEQLNVFPYQLRAVWDRLVYSGTGQAPVSLTSNSEMLARVSSTPGSIGYIDTSFINGHVHVLQIK